MIRRKKVVPYAGLVTKAGFELLVSLVASAEGGCRVEEQPQLYDADSAGERADFEGMVLLQYQHAYIRFRVTSFNCPEFRHRSDNTTLFVWGNKADKHYVHYSVSLHEIHSCMFGSLPENHEVWSRIHVELTDDRLSIWKRV